jgi:colicin import membrane protein
MKKILIPLLILSMVCFSSQPFSQNTKANSKKEQKVKDSIKAKEKEKDKDSKDKDKDKENQGKGNAYGKNKGDLQGKDFGQNRAAQAKTQKEAITAIDSNVTQTTQTNSSTLDKLKQAKVKLDTKKKSGQISEKDYQVKSKAITDLEAEVNALDKKAKEVKEKLDKEKAKE